jgi:multisubunit Na+/H+ antiporter MnhC subunit
VAPQSAGWLGCGHSCWRTRRDIDYCAHSLVHCRRPSSSVESYRVHRDAVMAATVLTATVMSAEMTTVMATVMVTVMRKSSMMDDG